MQTDSSEKHTILGDIHNGKAAELIEKNGVRFIRKPRSAAVELAYNAFLDKLSGEGFLYLPGKVEILNAREDRHDVRIVESVPLQSAAEAALYYKRCGALLFFTYLFSSNDLHHENIVASGAYPTIVDFETLLRGEMRRGSLSVKILSASVLNSHLLPHWKRMEERDIDNGGFSAKGKNTPTLGGKPVPAYRFTEEITAGFEYAFRFAMDRKPLFERLIHLFDSCSFRVLLRPTALYDKIAEYLQSQEPDKRELIARQLLERAYKKDVDRNRIIKAAKTLDAEIAAVLHEEAPLFTVCANGRDLQNHSGVLQKDFLVFSPIEKALSVLDELNLQDMEAQKRLIKQSLNAACPKDEKHAARSGYADAFRTVFKSLENTNIYGLPTGWMHLERDSGSRLFFQNCGFGFYHGLLGILCGYTALWRKTGDAQILDALLRHYEMYRQYAIPETLSLTDRNACLQDGAGGHLSALCHIGKLTGLPQFYADAERLLQAIAMPETLSGSCDVLGGYAGLALALPRFDTPKAAELAEAMAPQLLSYTPTLSGMAHGAAGVALALGALGSVLHTDRFDGRILELLRWENQTFDKQVNNWYDLRQPEKNGFMSGWCSGAPGIGLARARLLQYTENAEIASICRRDTDAVRQMLLHCTPSKKDCLCCGNAARLVTASVLGVPMPQTVELLTERVLSDDLQFYHIADTCDVNSGLMQGLAGVGYALAMYTDEECGGMLY